MRGQRSSRIPGLYRLSPRERLIRLQEAWSLSPEARRAIGGGGGLSVERADQMVENVVGLFALPQGMAVNLRMNGEDLVVPMVVEEPSVVAAVCNMARLARQGEGVVSESDPSVMISQIQVLDYPDAQKALQALEAHKSALLEDCRVVLSRLVNRGGGPTDMEFRHLTVDEEDGGGEMIVVHVYIDCLEAMGANLCNAAAERLAPTIAEITGGRVGLRILSNLSDRRKATARVRLAPALFSQDPVEAHAIIRGIVEAYQFAAADPYRAATHNKGVMNGIDAVALATGNDWRAIEAGAHAYVSRDGRYKPMSRWFRDEDGALCGESCLPMAVGVVGGTIAHHPTVRANLEVLGNPSARKLSEIMVAVGLLQNLAALYALSTEGIQRGHMSLQTRNVAARAGVPADLVSQVAAQMAQEGIYTENKAVEIWQQLEGENTERRGA